MEPRRTPRAPVTLDLKLSRRRGAPVCGHTEDLGPGGARVVVDRPLQVDEELDFDLTWPDGHVDGRCRVVRQQGLNCYALRFEALEADAAARLGGVVARTT
jgi:hypothetical protein